MLSLPPTPEIGLLQVPLPDLNKLEPDSPVRRFSRAARELAATDPLDAAVLARGLGRYDEAISLATRGLHHAFLNSNPAGVVRAFAIQASALACKGNFRAASEVVRQIDPFADADSTGSFAAIRDETSANLHLRTAVQDWFADARDLFESAHRGYQASSDPLGEVRANIGLSSVLSGYGDYLSSVEHVDRGLRICAELDDWRYAGRLLLEAALALRDQGYRQNVESLFQLSMAWSEFVGDEFARIRGLYGLAYLYDFEADVQRPEDQIKSEAVFLQAISDAKAIGAIPLVLEARSQLLHLYGKFENAEGVDQQRALAAQESTELSLSSAPKWLEYHADYLQYVETHRHDRNLARLREGIEGVTEPFFIFDPILRADGSFDDLLNEFRNSAADQLVDSGPAAVRTLADLSGMAFMQGLPEPLLRAISDREPYEDEVCISEAGEATWYSRRIVPAGDAAVLTLRNSTDSRNVENALRIAAERANQADRAKSEFLANMSHEVRTPINGVLGLARLLADSELDEDQRVYVEGIISSGDVLLRVIGDVLDLSKIEAHSMEVDAQPTDVHALVAEVVRLHRGQATEKDVDLRGMVEVDVPTTVLLDGPRVRQILGNLVGNAVKFTAVGSIQVSLRVVESSLEFQVEDSGIGVPEDRLDSIFKPFQQAATSQGGTGLGLTISKRLVELMGGRMSVTSRVGVGSRFTFRLPLRVVESAVRDEAPTIVSLHGTRVLLVEDNEVNVLVAKGLLRKLGCSISTASNGSDAVKRVAKGHYDVVLMDVRMPIMDGLAATREIRRREVSESLQRIPIVALTAGTLTDERDECFEAGMDDYLAKPFTLEALSATIARWIEPT